MSKRHKNHPEGAHAVQNCHDWSPKRNNDYNGLKYLGLMKAVSPKWYLKKKNLGTKVYLLPFEAVTKATSSFANW